MRSHFLSVIKFAIGWPLSLVALFFIAKVFFTHSSVLGQFLHLNYLFIFLSLISYLTYFIFRVLFWKQLTREKDIYTDFVDTAYMWSMSELKRYVPGNIWSFVGRAQSYEKYEISKKNFAHLLFLEVLFLLLSTAILSLLSANFIFYNLLTSLHLKQFYINFSVILVILFAAVFLCSKYIFSKVPILHKVFPIFSIKKNIFLFSLMGAAFLFFGLGTYFVVSSVAVLFVPHILPLSGFFVFTYLIGYVSFITPMGLGVREGLMTLGLSKYISLFDAASGALVSRIVLIAAELIFLAGVSVWLRYKKTKQIQQVSSLLKRFSYEISMMIFVGIYTVYFTLASFLRYTNFFTGRFDLGNMDQTVWNTIHGRFFQLTNPDGTNIVSRLSFHADYILAILSPFYYIWQDPRMLLLIQTIALASGAVFVFLIGKNILKNKPLSLIFSVAYLIHPAINHANLFDFHGVVIAVPLFLAAWYFIVRKNYIPAVLLILLAGTTKEEVWLVSGMFGLVLLFQRKKFLGIFVTLVSFSLFYYLFFKAIPQAHGGNHFALSYYSDFGSTPGGIIKNIFFSPLKAFAAIFQKDKLWYLFELFFPFGFLSILSPLFIFFAGPDLAVSLLSQNTQLHNIYFHYGAIIVPFAILSAIYGVAYLTKILSKLSTFYVGLFVLITSITAAYWYGPLPGAMNMNQDMFTNQLSYRDNIEDFLQTIPRRYSVAATNNVGSHLSHRQLIYTIPLGIDKADVIVFLLNDQFAQPSLEAQKEFAQTLSRDPHYVKVYEYQDFVLFTKKGLPLRPLRKTHTFNPPLFH